MHLIAKTAIVIATVAATALAAPGPGLVLVENGTNACPIFAARGHAEAATNLAQYLERISGAAFAVRTNEPPAAGRSIRVGYPDGRDWTGSGDAYAIRVSEESLEIGGATRTGVRFGVFAFLEDRLGCRWWSATEEDVPRSPTVRLDPGETVKRPPFRQMLLMNREAESKDGGFRFKARSFSTQDWTGGHTLNALLESYAASHPEILPFSRKTGRRAANQIHFCYSAPGIADAVAAALAAQVRQRKGNVRDWIYMAGMGDAYGGACECERCEAIYLEEGWTDKEGKRRGIIGGTNLRMINRVAEILDAQFPGIQVGTMPYMSMEAPPTLTVPRSNVVARVPHLRHCIIHGVRDCPDNAGYAANLRKWGQLAPGRVHVWDYAVNFGDNFMYPFPVIRSIAANMRYYAESGVGGLIIQGNYVSTGGDLVVLKNYVWRHLLWDPAGDPDALVREFCAGYYGPAAAPLLAYVADLEDAAATALTNQVHLDEFAERGPIARAYLGRERMAKQRGLMDDARRLSAGREPYARRVEEAAVSLDAFDLWRPGPLAEADGRLIRPDLTNVAAGGWTFDRALRLCQHARQASPREWGAYRHYHELFLASHGGPLVTLRRGDVAVRVASAIGLRIRQIEFRGRPLLRVSSNTDEEGWPAVGGAVERVYPSWTYGMVSGVPTETSVTMDTDHVSGSSVKQSASKRVELTEDGVIRITVGSQAISRLPGNDFTRCAHVTEYAVGTNVTGVAIEAMSTSGVWTAVAFSPSNEVPARVKGQKAGKPRRVLVGRLPASTTALRVALPSAGCVVDDRYVAPAIIGGSVRLADGMLRVSVETARASVPRDEKRLWLEREIRISGAADRPR